MDIVTAFGTVKHQYTARLTSPVVPCRMDSMRLMRKGVCELVPGDQLGASSEHARVLSQPFAHDKFPFSVLVAVRTTHDTLELWTFGETETVTVVDNTPIVEPKPTCVWVDHHSVTSNCSYTQGCDGQPWFGFSRHPKFCSNCGGRVVVFN